MVDENVTHTGIAWQETVEREHAQSDRIREESASEDFWKPVAHRFVPPKKGESAPDDTVEKLAELILPSESVLDVGAGGGRLSVPLAEYASHVTAVEPSEAMRDQLTATADAWGVSNVSVIPSTWEEADVDSHDLVVCAHVVYTVTAIEAFVRKLNNHARKKVALISFERPATATYLPLWSYVHGEERIALPTLPQIESLLGELKIEFEETPLKEWAPRPFKSREQAQSECEARLFVAPGSDKSKMLSEVLDSSLIEVEGGLRLEWAESHRPLIISWDVR
ncbi:class I SAM-dependent methyltransferase [Candidatus Lucifugimonas marina]|uniref:Methyltransferase domain-containing protein n=1 Tax=Candidatus Lucifugimonas marina TaxID=3038979 RepID=A0AAJ6CVX3_9CHLR|nr:methyltransferase domain-containing protein [SAR202 cluster bacterium JH702]MDG0869273.1 methyltransferase domain-containing protein [SAR202 cluster bacterium JH639]WFG36675.1 methyltransferase domain-containing protein [SAR202 cluster bacterium JH545]WFG40609.1 methyltransferase domain-containing protein [SAR202 cluster bacterium JH1073]